MFLGDVISNTIKDRSTIKLNRAQILCVMHPWERKLVPQTVCFIRILCASWPAGILSVFVLHTAHSLFGVIWSSACLLTPTWKTGRTTDLSHQIYLIEWLHISLSFLCVWIKAVCRRHQDYLFCLVESKVNRRGRAKISEQTEEEGKRSSSSSPEENETWRWKRDDVERWGSQDIKKHTEIVKGSRRWRKDGVWKQRWTDGFGQWARSVPGQAMAN